MIDTRDLAEKREELQTDLVDSSTTILIQK